MEVDEKVSESKEEQKSAEDTKIVKKFSHIDYPGFDVGRYASKYVGKVKIDRLLHIARVCPSLKKDCYRVAVAEVRQGLDVGLYGAVMEEAQKVLGAAECQFDAAWMTSQQQSNEKQVRYLEEEIQRWRNLSNREKICASYLEAAEYCVAIGNFNTAISRYIEAKSYAGDSQMLLDINLKIMVTSIRQGQFGHVKGEASHALASEDIFKDNKLRSKVLCCLALYNLYNGRYDMAVHNLIDCHFSVYSAFPEVLSGADIALYGGLCALASFTRMQLKKRVLDNSEFKRFLELQPKVGALIQGFYDSEYGKVMSGLNGLRNDIIMDLYLFPRVDHLLTAIRGKALVQYFSPYSAMDINKMASSFKVPVPEMEQELSVCIGDGHIKAKIDSHNKIVYASKTDKRNELFRSVLDLGEDFERDMKAVLLRTSLIRNQVIVSQSRADWLDAYDMEDGQGGAGGFMQSLGRKLKGSGGGAGGAGGGGAGISGVGVSGPKKGARSAKRGGKGN
eukprot:CAMPEP_0202703178 /NCGR_PEP_ID=MMETSP1385-20130828/16044_1 /ASSEMBLY_ACC=CAM_ASM_000861 /TAXON_ID=933848 /ORGANISM="Elphidium margaritaceum" /LENGTH=504 /DNA_ID=CAMNT_0049360977 /DNA_START=82 /DNA_END=1596 /DNA_ORIENTATION=+